VARGLGRRFGHATTSMIDRCKLLQHRIDDVIDAEFFL
jgi:hypothetical protein